MAMDKDDDGRINAEDLHRALAQVRHYYSRCFKSLHNMSLSAHTLC